MLADIFIITIMTFCILNIFVLLLELSIIIRMRNRWW